MLLDFSNHNDFGLFQAHSWIRKYFRKLVGDTFGQYSEVIKSWMKSLTYTRNLCAHHARLWNRFFINKPQGILVSYLPVNNTSPFYMQAYIILKLLNAIAPNHHWKNHLLALFDKNQSIIQFNAMGFDKHWKQDTLWTL